MFKSFKNCLTPTPALTRGERSRTSKVEGLSRGLSCLTVILLCVSSLFAEQTKLDKTRYITIDEIQPGMQAYCLTCYKGTEIEKFDLEVLSVIRGHRPGRNAILVQGTDKRFIHTGPVGGCSGSPVYIEGRLAGALAFGWLFSKDPLYGVTPIEEMLQAGKVKYDDSQNLSYIDYSMPIDFERITQKILDTPLAKTQYHAFASPLPCPLITTGLPDSVCKELDETFGLGFMAVTGMGAVAQPDSKQNVQLVPGACLAVPLVTGDITMEAIGTVTEVVGDKVYGFGHSFMGYGAIDLPMATGQIHTVVSSIMRSFKYGTSIDIVGTLTADEATAVVGQIGKKPKMMSLTITVDRYNDTTERIYNCKVAYNKVMTPRLIRAAVIGALSFRGNLPPNHKIEYKVSVGVKDNEPVVFENISTGRGFLELISESVGVLAILMDNPYKKVDVTSIDYHVKIVPEDVISHIWSANLSDSTVKAGQYIDLDVVIEAVLAGKKKYRFNIQVPENTPPGKYNLIVCGGINYLRFLMQTTPQKFIVLNFNDIIQATNRILSIRRDSLFALLVLPPGGLTIEKADLPDLPATKQLVLNSPKRSLDSQPYQQWLQKSLDVGSVVIDKKLMQITVEK